MPLRISTSAARRMGLTGEQRSKFHVDQSEAGKLARTYNGRVYDSQAECRYAGMLDQRKRVGDIESWWPQVPVPLKVNGITVCKMIFDFEILHHDQTKELIDVKGVVTAVFSLKLRLLKALHPELRVTVVPSKEVR
jgi:hypothetical protein